MEKLTIKISASTSVAGNGGEMPWVIESWRRFDE